MKTYSICGKYIGGLKAARWPFGKSEFLRLDNFPIVLDKGLANCLDRFDELEAGKLLEFDETKPVLFLRESENSHGVLLTLRINTNPEEVKISGNYVQLYSWTDGNLDNPRTELVILIQDEDDFEARWVDWVDNNDDEVILRFHDGYPAIGTDWQHAAYSAYNE